MDREDINPTDETPILSDDGPDSQGLGRQLLAVTAANFGAISLGLVLGFTSTTLEDMKESGQLTATEASWYSSLAAIGALVGGPTGGFLADVFGRKSTIMMLSVPYLAGWMLNFVTSIVYVRFLGRFLAGMACGMSSLVIPLYIAEVSLPVYRGFLGTCFQFSTTLGILISYILGIWINWAWLTVCSAFFPTVLVIVMIFIPESPRWLLARERREEALKSLCWLRGTTHERDVSSEWVAMDDNLSSACENKTSLCLSDLKRRSIYGPFLLSLALMFFQQFSGINAIIFFTQSIFTKAHFTLGKKGVPTVLIGALNVVMTIISAAISDKVGRRVLFMASSGVTAVSCLVFGLYYYFEWAAQWISLVCLAVYIGGFAVGLGPLPWLVTSELLSPKGYGITSGISTAFNWASVFVITKEYNDMEAGMHSYGLFWFYGTMCILGVVVIGLFLPETRGKSLQEIAQYFEDPTERNYGKEYTDNIT